MGSWIHRILYVDWDKKEVECANCGVVPLAQKNLLSGDTRAMCSIVKEQRRGKRKPSKRPHGLTAEEAKKYREGKCCAICGSTEQLVVDHCHSSNKIRDVLCHRHNAGLGFFRDCEDELQAAIEYLRLHR